MENKINVLRKEITLRLGDYRARHVLSTEEEAAKLAKLYIPEKEQYVRISALLHDITKEYDLQKQLQIIDEFDIIVDSAVFSSPKVFHSVTAPKIIERDFPEFATDEVLSSVRKHTAGSADMTVFDCIIYLADYIEPTRKFPDCAELREYFWTGIQNCKDEEEKLFHLHKTMVLSFDLTIKNLICENSVIVPDTFSARNMFLMKISEENKYEKAR